MKKSTLEKIKSVWKGWKNAYLYWTNQLPLDIRGLMDDRLQVCRSNECGKFLAGICTACGCPVSKKAKSLTETCPENMWNPSVYQIDDSEPFILISEIPKPIQRSFLAYIMWGTVETKKNTKIMKQVKEPWARLAVWDEFLEWEEVNEY